MIKNDKSIVVIFKFKYEIKFDLLNDYFENLYKNLFKTNIKFFSYSIIDKSKFDWKLKSKQYLYSLKNVNKFKKLLENSEKIEKGFEFLKPLDNYEYKSRDIEFSTAYSEALEYPTIKIIINAQKNDINIENLIKDIFKFIANDNEIVYGFVSTIDNEKMPSFYVEGILTENLNDLEKQNIQKWADNENKCDQFLWDIFEGNVFTENHLKRSEDLSRFINNYEDVILILDKNTYFMNLTKITSKEFLKIKNEMIPFFNILITE